MQNIDVELETRQKILDKVEYHKLTIDDICDGKKGDRESDPAFSTMITLAKACNADEISESVMFDVLECSEVIARKKMSVAEKQNMVHRAFKAAKGQRLSLIYADKDARQQVRDYKRTNGHAVVHIEDEQLHINSDERVRQRRERGLKHQQTSLKCLNTILSKGRDIELIKQNTYLIDKRLTAFHEFFFVAKDHHGAYLGYPLFTFNQHNALKLVGYNRIYYPNIPDGFERDRAVSSGAYADDKKCLGQFVIRRDGQKLANNDICYLCEGAADAVSVLASTLRDCYSCESVANMPYVALMLKSRYKQVICCVDNDKAGHEMKERLEPHFTVKMPVSCKDFSDVFIISGAKIVCFELDTEIDRTVLNKLQVIRACQRHRQNNS